MPKISKSCYTSQFYSNYIKTIYKLMQCKITTSKKRTLKKILIDFSRKENAITRYTRKYIKTKWQG